jgi:hypothetical protein
LTVGRCWAYFLLRLKVAGGVGAVGITDFVSYGGAESWAAGENIQ